MPLKKRLKHLKLIAFDLDGTLLDDHGKISGSSAEQVRYLQKNGIRFTLVTGRLHSAIIPFAEQLSLKLPLISLDGALIKSYPDEEILYESFVPVSYVRKAVNYSQKYDIKAALCHGDAIFYTSNNESIRDIMHKFDANYEMVNGYEGYLNSTLEVVMVGDNEQAMRYVRRKFSFPFSRGLSTSYHKSQGDNNRYYLELRKAGSSKGESLIRLIKHLKISIKETAVLGDWYNDRSLFETGALKVAVANAVPEIKNKADIVLQKSNNEDAAAEFLYLVSKSIRDK